MCLPPIFPHTVIDHFLGHDRKALLNIHTIFGRSLHNGVVVFLSQLAQLFLRDGPLVMQVRFVADNHLLAVFIAKLADLVQPEADVVKALPVGYRVDQEDSVGPAVVGRGDGLEALLPGSVPDLQLD